MKKLFFPIVLLFVLTACSTTFPDTKADISSFIPQEKALEDVVFEDFAAANFPDKCEWFGIKSVSDGDTIVLEDDTKVRFVGIDTPETVHPTKPVQYCGKEASNWTKKIFEGTKKVCLIYDKLSDERDTYGRRLAYPFTEEGVDTTSELLQLGLARGYFYFPFSRKEEFRFYHDQAKQQKRGVWGKSLGTCEKV